MPARNQVTSYQRYVSHNVIKDTPNFDIYRTAEDLRGILCPRKQSISAAQSRNNQSRWLKRNPIVLPPQETRHGETEERLPAKLHPLSGLHAHDAHGAPLLQVPLVICDFAIPPHVDLPGDCVFVLWQRRPDLCVGARLFLDARAHCGHHEQGIASNQQPPVRHY